MGGGSGNAGTIKYPQYLQTLHQKVLEGYDPIQNLNFNVVSAMNSAKTSNPFENEVSYDPTNDIDNFFSKINNLESNIPTSPTGTWGSYIDSAKEKIDDHILDDDVINDTIDAHSDLIDDRYETQVKPKFEAGMNDLNAVMSSSFVVGKAILDGFNERDKNDFAKKLRLDNYRQRNVLIEQGTKDMLSVLLNAENLRDAVARYNIEGSRIKFVMKNEQQQQKLYLKEQESLWDLTLFQYIGNTMSAISGSAGLTKSTVSPLRSTIGGAVSGAATGAQVGGPLGAAIGAVVGGGLGYLDK